jgi:hypothetical protein
LGFGWDRGLVFFDQSVVGGIEIGLRFELQDPERAGGSVESCSCTREFDTKPFAGVNL